MERELTEPPPRRRAAPEEEELVGRRRRRQDDDDYYEDRGERPFRSRRQRGDGMEPNTGVQTGLGIAALGIGIIGLIISLIPCIGFFIGLPIAGVGLLLGLVGLIVGISRNNEGLGFPIAGLGVSLAGVVVACVWWIFFYTAVTTTATGLNKLADDMKKAGQQPPGQPIPVVLVNGEAKMDAQLTKTDPRDKVFATPYKVYTVTMNKGKTYQIDMVKGGLGLDPYLRLEDSKGTKLVEDDDGGGNLNARIIFNCPKEDTYRIVCTTLFGEGNFTLTVREKKAAALGPALPLTFKDGIAKVVGELKLDDPTDTDRKGCPCKIYAVNLAGGKKYQIDMRRNMPGIEPFVRLEDDAGKQLRFADSGGMDNARMTFVCPKDGTFRVICTVHRPKTGSYTLTVREPGAIVPTLPLTLIGGVAKVEGELKLDDGTDADRLNCPCKVYTVNLAVGKIYEIEMRRKAPGMRPYVRLEDDTGNQMAFEDSKGGDSARFSIQAPKNGTFHLICTVFQPATGNYTLTVKEK
jgi:hypothetical protein